MTKLLVPTNVQPAIWLSDTLSGFASNVNSIVPSGFKAYARLLHSAYTSFPSKRTRVSWQTVANHIGMTINKTSHWEDIAVSLPNHVLDLYEIPIEGTLDPETYEKLMAILVTHTKTPEICWYAFWEGYGYILQKFKKAPIFSLTGRSYYLLRGACTLHHTFFCSGSFFQSANIFWPDDRAWCVASEIDFCSTYIAATEEAIGDLLTHFNEEIFRVAPDEKVTLN